MFRRSLVVPFAVALALFALSEALANSATTAPAAESAGLSIELGRTEFRTYCAACHGISGKGDGTMAEFLTITASDLTMLQKMNGGIFPRERITQVIDGRTEVKVHGARDMPVWGDWFNYEAISPDTDAAAREQIISERINSLVAYIETIQER